MKKGCLIAFLMPLAVAIFGAVGIRKALTPWSLSDKDPRQMVELFVCSPVIDSIHSIEARGVIAPFAGGEACIDFQIDPQDAELLLKRGRFKAAGENASEWIREFKPNSEDYAYELSRYVRHRESGSETALFISRNREKVWFRHFKY